MREIVLDTETTGLDPAAGHRIVEVGCVELMNGVPTGRELHRYINPERDMPEEAFRVHGISSAFLADKPVFAQIAEEFLEFVGDSPLVIHNAEFDMRFLNAEITRLGKPVLANPSVCTVQMARRLQITQASLDALCKRYGIDNSKRDKHGALLDAGLLASVYLELTGGRQRGLTLEASTVQAMRRIERVFRAPRPHAPQEAELVAHAAMVAKLKNPLWAN